MRAGLCILVLLFIACHASKESAPKHISPDKFANVLDYSGTPKSTFDRSVFMFSDLGSWFGYALPEKELLGSFIGPFSMMEKNGYWLSKTLAKFDILSTSSGKMISFDEATEIVTQSTPNKLHQSCYLPALGLKISTDLIFASNQTAVIRYSLDALDGSIIDSIQLIWSGTSMEKNLIFSKEDETIRLAFPDIDDTGIIRFSGLHFETSTADSAYVVRSNPFMLKKGYKKEIIISQSLCFSEAALNKEDSIIERAHGNIQALIQENESRWNAQVQSLISTLKPEFQSEKDQRAAIKCLQTLNNNWRSPAGFLEHDGLFPSYNYEWFHGFWAWDSWKHAVALALYNPTLAKNQIRAMYDFQDEYGMIADCVYRDTTIEQHNWRNTKPPLSAWAIAKVFEATQDTSFLSEMLPQLEKYHQWWYKNRDHDQNGLCEYGSTDGTLIAAKWESGMDNAVRFDRSSLRKNNNNAWSLDQESVDLNAYLCFEKTHLSRIHKILGNDSLSKNYETEADTLKLQIQGLFFNDSTGWYFDIDLESKKHLETAGAEGWIPLFTRIATQEQAAKMLPTLLDTNRFATYIPFPILSADHPKFKPDGGYWRGPVWLDHSFFAIQSLLNYGYTKEATRYTEQLMNHLEGFKDSPMPVFENYHPLTGEGLESKHFSWSAAHLLLLMVDDDTE